MSKMILAFEDKEIVGLIINIAAIYKMKGMLEHAEKCLDEALRMSRQHSYNQHIVISLTHYGETWERQGLNYVAMASFKEALQIKRHF